MVAAECTPQVGEDADRKTAPLECQEELTDARLREAKVEGGRGVGYAETTTTMTIISMGKKASKQAGRKAADEVQAGRQAGRQ